VTESDVGIDPDFLRIRTAKRHETRQMLKQFSIYWCAIKVNDSDNTAHI
jgi:hypothetical protein